MFVKTSQLIVIRAQLDAVLDNLIQAAAGAAGAFNDTTIRLFSNDFTPDYDSILTDFTECTFGGYAAAAVTWVGPVNTDAEEQGLIFNANFEATDAVTPETAYGMYLTDGAGATLLAAERFAASVPFAQDGDFLNYDLILNQKGLWDTPA